MDLVITNDSFIDNIDYLAPLGNSDHSLLDITYNSSGFSKVDTKKFNFSKGNIYRSPQSDIHNDFELFNLINKVSSLINSQFVLVGDFNFHIAFI